MAQYMNLKYSEAKIENLILDKVAYNTSDKTNQLNAS